jgi:hypothetical protein
MAIESMVWRPNAGVAARFWMLLPPPACRNRACWRDEFNGRSILL